MWYKILGLIILNLVFFGGLIPFLIASLIVLPIGLVMASKKDKKNEVEFENNSY